MEYISAMPLQIRGIQILVPPAGELESNEDSVEGSRWEILIPRTNYLPSHKVR